MFKIFTNIKFYIFLLVLLIVGALGILFIDMSIMPAYTSHNKGVTVPDVTRLTLDEAEELLHKIGLRFEIADRRANSTFPANYVLDQQPAATNIVKPNRKVYLTVNTEVKPTVEVPNVTNLSLRNAEIQLQNYGLEVGTITYESSRFRNVILRQSISQGTIVDKGTTLDLVVSDGLGDKIVKIPEIVGLTLPQAQYKLREAGLRVGEINFKPTRDVEPNTVLEYTPDVKEIVEGETLNLIISEVFEVKEEEEGGAIFDDSSNVDLNINNN